MANPLSKLFKGMKLESMSIQAPRVSKKNKRIRENEGRAKVTGFVLKSLSIDAPVPVVRMKKMKKPKWLKDLHATRDFDRKNKQFHAPRKA